MTNGYIVTDGRGKKVRLGDLRANFGICPNSRIVRNAAGKNARFSEAGSGLKVPFKIGDKVTIEDGLKIFVKQQMFQFQEIPR